VGRLLAAGLDAALTVAGTDDDKRLFPGTDDAVEVRAERGETATVSHHLSSVDPHRRIVVDGLEMQHRMVTNPIWRDRDTFAVPDGLQKVDVADT
jgi:hypothetical protein